MTSTVDDIPTLQDSRGYRSVSLHFPAVMRFLSDRNVGSFPIQVLPAARKGAF